MTGSLWTAVLMMLAQTTWGGYTLLTKPLLSRRQPLYLLAAACRSCSGSG